MEDILDRLLAEMLANRILCMRMWGYLASATDDEVQFVERQRKLTLESVEAWNLQGHRDPATLKAITRAAINAAWDEVLRNPPAGSPL